MQTAIQCLVGQQIGKRDVPEAKRMFNVGFSMGLVALVIYIIILATCRHFLVGIYTDEEDVQEFIKTPFAFMICAFTGNWLITLINGATRGLGKQKVAA